MVITPVTCLTEFNIGDFCFYIHYDNFSEENIKQLKRDIIIFLQNHIRCLYFIFRTYTNPPCRESEKIYAFTLKPSLKDEKSEKVKIVYKYHIEPLPAEYDRAFVLDILKDMNMISTFMVSLSAKYHNKITCYEFHERDMYSENCLIFALKDGVTDLEHSALKSYYTYEDENDRGLYPFLNSLNNNWENIELFRNKWNIYKLKKKFWSIEYRFDDMTDSSTSGNEEWLKEIWDKYKSINEIEAIFYMNVDYQKNTLTVKTCFPHEHFAISFSEERRVGIIKGIKEVNRKIIDVCKQIKKNVDIHIYLPGKLTKIRFKTASSESFVDIEKSIIKIETMLNNHIDFHP